MKTNFKKIDGLNIELEAETTLFFNLSSRVVERKTQTIKFMDPK